MKSRIFWRSVAVITIGATTMLPMIASADEGDDNVVQAPERPAPPPIESLYPQYGQFLNLVDRTDDAALAKAYNGNFPLMPQPADDGD